MTKARKRFLLGLIVLVIAVGLAYIWNSLPKAGTWDRGYPLIAEGDPEEKVIEILGRPTETNDCDRFRYSRPDIWQKCAEEYRYIAFMQEWGYLIDKDGKVILKWHMVSQ